MNAEETKILARLAALLDQVAEEKRPCRLCGETCYWIRTRGGWRLVLNADATHHKTTCRRAPLTPPVKTRTKQDEFFPRDARANAFDPA
jgi:hypothetical protein